jgi:hypothetical protein
MRNPFSRKSQPMQEILASSHPVNVGKLRERMVAWSMENDRDSEDPAYLLEMNKAILELAVEAERLSDAGNDEEGEWVLFLIDENGWVLNQERRYLVPDDQRVGNVWGYLDDELAFFFSDRFTDDQTG